MICGGSSMADGTCSFCGKRAEEVFRLISSNGCKICSECIGRCANMIAEEFQQVVRDMQMPPRNPDGPT